LDKRGGAAVHYGNFGGIEFDFGIVDAEAVQGGEQMFSGGYHRFTLADGGGESGIYDLVHTGFDGRTPGDVDTAELEARVFRGGLDSEVDRSAGVQTYAAAADRLFDGILKWIKGKVHRKAF